MRRTLLAFVVAFLLGLAFAVPASASSPTIYTRTCHPWHSPALKAKTWVHFNPDGGVTWTRPRATPYVHSRSGLRWRFAYFTFNDKKPRGYQHPYYGWRQGVNWIGVHWVNNRGNYRACTLAPLYPVRLT